MNFFLRFIRGSTKKKESRGTSRAKQIILDLDRYKSA